MSSLNFVKSYKIHIEESEILAEKMIRHLFNEYWEIMDPEIHNSFRNGRFKIWRNLEMENILKCPLCELLLEANEFLLSCILKKKEFVRCVHRYKNSEVFHSWFIEIKDIKIIETPYWRSIRNINKISSDLRDEVLNH